MGKYEITEHKKGFWAIDEGGVRSFLIEGNENALLVDTGFGTGDIKSVVQKLTEKPVILVNTHTDRDHTGGNNLFGGAYMHPLEIEDYLDKAGTAKLTPVTAGYVFDLGGKRYEVIETPGHTPGSIMLLNREERTLISGDSIGMAPIFMFGPKRDLDTYIKSLDMMAGMTKEFDTVYPSHGPCPVEPQIIAELIEGAKKLKNGELEGSKAPYNLQCKLYEHGNAKFLY